MSSLHGAVLPGAVRILVNGDTPVPVPCAAVDVLDPNHGLPPVRRGA
jgi:hypothetical protein